MKRKIIIHECEVQKNAQNVPEVVTKAVRGPALELNEVGVDESIAAARKLMLAQKRQVRSISIRADGDIQVIVWKGDPPKPGKDPYWIWKRPRAQPAEQ